jgi:hypothetical protein
VTQLKPVVGWVFRRFKEQKDKVRGKVLRADHHRAGKNVVTSETVIFASNGAETVIHAEKGTSGMLCA